MVLTGLADYGFALSACQAEEVHHDVELVVRHIVSFHVVMEVVVHGGSYAVQV